MDKKGLSAVIVTTLVILISLALIGILTALALPFIKENIAKTATTTAGFTVRLVAVEDSILVQQPTIPARLSYETRLIVRRDTGNGNLTGFILRLKDINNREYTTFTFANISLNEFESYTTVFNHTLQSNVSLLTVIPYVLVNGDRQMLASAAVSYSVDWRGRFAGIANNQMLIQRAACEDTFDNDNDGFTDLLDLGCGGVSDASEETECQDNVDNDNDGWEDMEDPACTSVQILSEVNNATTFQCSDALDNDNDGVIDGHDDDCASWQGASESGSSIACGNGVDDDNDGLIDGYDPGCTSLSDTSESNSALVLVVEQVSGTAWNNANANNAERSWGVNGNYIDCNRDGTVDVGVLRQCLDSSLIPQGQTYIQCPQTGANIGRCDIPSGTRYVYLDMEDPWTSTLKSLSVPIGSPAFENAQDQLVLAVNTAKAIRPDLKFGIYPFPLMHTVLCDPPGSGNCFYHASSRNTPQVMDFYMARALAPTRVFDAVDFTSPDIYESYSTYPNSPYVISSADEIAFAQHATEAAIEGAPNKPAFPFVWHRFNPGPYIYSLIPHEEMIVERVDAAIDAGANGVFWWGADQYFMSVAYRYPSCSSHTDPFVRDTVCPQTRTAFGPELGNASITNPVWPGNGEIQSYLDGLHEDYLNFISNAL